MTLTDLINKSCLIGLSYFETDGTLLKQSQCCGRVTQVDEELGITVQLQHTDPEVQQADFILPPNLAAWYNAPAGRFTHAANGVDIENPDYLVTWDIHRTQETRTDGQHEWWDWVPNVQAPSVGQGTLKHH